MHKIYEISLLFDFYGSMLTERQSEVLDLHYNEDYSLGEIADMLKISRQGVFDNIKRATKTLEDIEKKLGLVDKFIKQKIILEEILNVINDLNFDELNEYNKNCIKKIKEKIGEINI